MIGAQAIVTSSSVPVGGPKDGVSLLPVILNMIKIKGIYVGSTQMLTDLYHTFKEHNVKPVIDKVFSFNEVPAALPYMASGAHFG